MGAETPYSVSKTNGKHRNGCEKLVLGPELLNRFRPVKAFYDNTAKINHMHHTEDGRMMIASSEDDSMILYDCVAGCSTNTVYSKKYGCSLVHFVRGTNNVIHSSTKVDNIIRYLSLNTNQYVRYFQGHEKLVTVMKTSPVDEVFMSGSLDRTIRLWDMRIPAAQGMIKHEHAPLIAFDPTGVCFAVGLNSETIELYDVRAFDTGPFASYTLSVGSSVTGTWTDLAFSPDGLSLLVMTNGRAMLLIDAFTNELKFLLQGHRNSSSEPLMASFSASSQLVFCGGDQGVLTGWSRDSGALVYSHGADDHKDLINQVAFNPKFMVLGTASTQIRLWAPLI